MCAALALNMSTYKHVFFFSYHNGSWELEEPCASKGLLLRRPLPHCVHSQRQKCSGSLHAPTFFNKDTNVVYEGLTFMT